MIVDLHCHILPGVDDGAYTMEDALTLAQMAVDSGVDTLVATPHHRYYGHDNQAQIREAFIRLQDALAYEQIPLTLHLATELWGSRGQLPDLQHDMTFPDSPWFLIEFAVDESAEHMQAVLNHYARQGYLPLIAHPERYRALQEDPTIARAWVKKGWGVQINRDSLLGLFGQRCFYCADFLLRQGWANVIASDAHWVDERNTDWSPALDSLFKRYDAQHLWQCLKHNPRKILQGKPL